MDAAGLKSFLSRHKMLSREELELLRDASSDAETIELALNQNLLSSQLVEDAKNLVEIGLPKGLEPLLPGLVLLQEIGKGSSGVVFRAWQSKLRRIVAVKVLPRESLKDEQAKTRFIREARIAARLSHPSLVRAWDIGSAGESVFIILDYVAGESLQHRLHQEGTLSISESLRIGLGIADGLAYAATNGIAHRDIKPANIQLTKSGVKILDLGLARPEGESEMTLPMVAVGTPAYISPEQARGETLLTPKCDVYALGVLIFRSITGKHPFSAIDGRDMLRAHVERMPPAITSLAKECPEALSELVEEMMAKDPEARPSAAQVSGHLRLLLSQIDGTPHADSARSGRIKRRANIAPPNAAPSTPSSLYAKLAIALAALVIGAGGAWALIGDDDDKIRQLEEQVETQGKELKQLESDKRAHEAWLDAFKELQKAEVPYYETPEEAENTLRKGLKENDSLFSGE